jgi:hypothetical protein
MVLSINVLRLGFFLGYCSGSTGLVKKPKPFVYTGSLCSLFYIVHYMIMNIQIMIDNDDSGSRSGLDTDLLCTLSAQPRPVRIPLLIVLECTQWH